MNENDIHQNSTWKKAKSPRGNSHKRSKDKVTVSLYLSELTVQRAKLRRLNLSRVTEQALSSILDYMDKPNQTESSKFLNERSFPKESSCLGSLAWWGSALVRRGSRVQIPPEAPIFPEQSPSPKSSVFKLFCFTF